MACSDPEVTRRTWHFRVHVFVVVVMVSELTLPTLASAHARLIQSDRASEQIVQDPPQAVTLTFSEPIENALR